MNKIHNIKRLIVVSLLLLGIALSAKADGTKDNVETLYKYRFGVDFQIKIIKGLKLNIEPQFRFNDGYDNFILNGGLTYKTFGCIQWGATYRLIVDRVASSNSSSSSYNGFGSNNYDSEVFHRYAFDVTYKDKFSRFSPSLRVRYNNFMDDEITNKKFLRYRAKLEYDIKKCKVTPLIFVEAFQELDNFLMYKMRYGGGIEIKTSKRSYLSFNYKFDFFLLEYKNAHIFCANYKFKF